MSFIHIFCHSNLYEIEGCVMEIYLEASKDIELPEGNTLFQSDGYLEPYKKEILRR